MSFGAGRYDVKKNAGWTRQRPDGSSYDRQVDIDAADAEEWAANYFGVLIDREARLGGDQGWDFVVEAWGQKLKVDTIHAGRLADGRPRPGDESHLIVNPGQKKLENSDVLLLVEGERGRFRFVKAIFTKRFCRLAERKDFGFGPKLSMHASELDPVGLVLPVRE